jgi:hypothetical protein
VKQVVELRANRVTSVALVLAVGLVATGCGQKKMMLVQDQVKALYRKGDWGGAVNLYSKKDKDGKPEAFEPRDRVAYWLNLAMFLHMTDKFKESNDLLDKAVKRHDELYTTSISKGAASLVSNDTVQDYEGGDYEILLTYPLSMLNYMALGDPEKAMVQARALDERTKKLATKYPKKPAFNQDAFARWLTGVIEETTGETNRALISYKQAYIIYRELYSASFLFPIPRYLGEDITRTASMLGGFEQDIEKAKKYFKGDPDLGSTAKLAKDHGEIILIHGSGEAPEKKDYFITCSTDKLAPSCDAAPGDEGFVAAKVTAKAGLEQIKLALPIMSMRPWRVAAAKMTVWKAGEMEAAKAAAKDAKGPGSIMPAGILKYDPQALRAASLTALAAAKEASRRIQADPTANSDMQMYLRLGIYLANRAVWLDESLRPQLEIEVRSTIKDVQTAYSAAYNARQKNNKSGTGVKPEDALGPVLQAPVSLAGNEALSVPAQPVAAIALKDHSDLMLRTFAKQILSAVTKILLAKGGGAVVGKLLGDSVGKLFSMGAQAGMAAAAEADKRQWFTLPAVYNVARYWAEPGEYDVELTFYNASGGVVKHDVKKGVKVAAGKKTFINYRTID